MKYKDETPDNLGGLSDVLSAEVLKMINELLEQLQRAGHINNGSKIELVYVAPGAQHVETQVIASPCPPPKRGGNTNGREKGVEAKESFNDDTPLSALFRTNFHEKLRTVIESWRPYLVGDNTTVDALAMTRFEFDKNRIYSNKVYRDLCELDALGALQVSLSQLANYLSSHSNLSRSYSTLYQQLKYYRSESE